MSKNEATLLIRIKQVGGEALDKIGSSLEYIRGKAAVVGTALIGFGVAAIHSFKQSEDAANQLNQAMVNQGIYTADLANKYNKMATELESLTTFADDQITAAQAQIQMYIGQEKITKELTLATLDFAQAKKIDLATAATLVGKAIGGETDALSRYGIQIEVGADKTQKMAQVIQGLNGQFGGQAEAAAKGLGTLEQLKNTVDNLAESLGKTLAPFVIFASKMMKDFTEELNKNGSAFDAISGGVKNVSQVLLLFKELLVGTVARVSAELGVLATGISYLFQGEFKKASEAVSTGYDEINKMMVERKTQFDADWNALETAQADTREAKRLEEESLQAASDQRKLDLLKQTKASMFTLEEQAAAKILGVDLKAKDARQKFEDAKVAAQKDTLNTIATLQNSNNSLLAIAGKAAAITSIAIDTPMAVAKAYTLGPIAGPIAAGLIYTAMAAQAAKVAGVQLAEGGIVKARPGGIQATIGEGGQDEAVIPLDKAGSLGGGTTIIFNGPVLGDESQAMEFARAIDRSLLKLRQSNQSVAFEDII